MQHMMVTNNCKKTTAQIGAHLCASQALNNYAETGQTDSRREHFVGHGGQR